MEIIRYTDEYKATWDEFVKKAKNSHFFFQRDYMEYHNDRFEDFSLFVFDEKQTIISILPCNIKDNILYSHQGLTFGGFLTDENIKVNTMLEIFISLNEFCLKEKIEKIIYKCIPYIYHKQPSDEDRYALFVNDAKLIRRDVSSTINLKDRIEYQEQRRRAIKKAEKNNLIFEQSNKIEEYWKILEETLLIQHGVSPVHNAIEIEKLIKNFPDNIKLFVAKKEDRIIAGTLIFENEKIIHTQYLANSTEGRNLGALDFVLNKLITEVFKNKTYFDFGISTENNGRHLNNGLITQKEGFGSRAVVHDFYEYIIK